MTSFPRISYAVMVGLALISLIAAHPALAATNAADAKRLKTIFTDMIDRYRQEAESQGGSLTTEGEVMVEPSDNYYAITLPHLIAVSEDKSKVNLGMISINALPGDRKNEWKMTVAMPTPITMTGPDGRETGVLEIGSQNFAGVYQEDFRNFVRLTGKYRNIVFTAKTENAKITIPDLAMTYDLKENGKGLWSGPMNIKATDISSIFTALGSTAKIREINIQSSIKDYSIKEALAYQEKIEALMESETADKASASNTHAQGAYNMFFDFITKVWDGFGSHIGIKGLEINTVARADKPASSVKIASIGLGLDGSGFRNNKVTLHQTINMSDLIITPEPTGLNKAAPSNINIDLTLQNLPFKELVALGEKSLGQSLQTPEGSSLVAMNALANVQQLLTTAGTTLVIKDTRVANRSDYDVLLNGKANANIKAIFGATGKARLEIFGMDKLIAYAQQASTDPAVPEQQKAQAQQAVQSLTLLQMLGQQGKNAKGQDIRSYDLELTTEGKTMLNGADLMSVMGGMKPTP